MSRMNFSSALLTLVMFLLPATSACASDEQTVTEADSAFWHAYNDCDMATLGDLLTQDVEFYHDQTGLTVSRAAVVESLRIGPCGDPKSRLRRELVGGTLQFHPLAGGYALLCGHHRFYVTQPGKEERMSSQAEFATIWKLDHGHWRMHRILSFAHGPAPYTPPKPALRLPASTLDKYAGRYDSERIGQITVARDGDHLKLTAGSVVATLYPETRTRFFAVEKDLRFDFELAATGAVQALAVYENGAVTERALRAH
jgi:hypothetical protein